MSIQYEKMAQAGFTPSQRALEADEYIKSRNRFDNPDEFQYVGSSVGGPDGYMYIGPARFYTSGTEYAGFLCLLYTSPSPRDGLLSRMPSSA